VESRSKIGGGESEARTDLYDLQAHDVEPPLADEPVVTVDTTQALPVQLDNVCLELRRRLFE
jgi:hypothetical protein